MLTLKSSRLVLRRQTVVPQRTYFTSTIQTLSDGVLDLAIALPYPPSIPVYSTTIIAVTVVTRLILTVPFSIWVRRVRDIPLQASHEIIIGKETTMEDGGRGRASHT